MKKTATLAITINVHGIGPEAVDIPEDQLHGRHAHGRYTYGGGLARVLDTLGELRIPATFFWPVYEARRCPGLLARCLDEGHEVASQGNAFEDLAKLGADERAVLTRAHQDLAGLTGVAPAGFRYTSSGFSPNTLGILRDLGYAYDSSAIDDDRPYALREDGGGSMMELPWSEGLCDASYFGQRMTQDRAHAHLLEQAQALLDTDGYACLTLHPRADTGVGRQARLLMLRRLLGELDERFDLRHARCDALARTAAQGAATRADA